MEPRKLLFVSADAALVGDVAWQVHEEGHDVKYYVEADSDREIADGFGRVRDALVVTGKGETMQEAQRQAYERVGDVLIPNLYYRDDIGDRWVEGDGDRLHAWDYLGPAGE